ncbi:hypothetical protein AGIG_G20748 [Arapaima gigas]
MSEAKMYLFVVAAVCSAVVLQAAKLSPLIERISDHKDFRKLLRTRTNVLVIYTKSGQFFSCAALAYFSC